MQGTSEKRDEAWQCQVEFLGEQQLNRSAPQ